MLSGTLGPRSRVPDYIDVLFGTHRVLQNPYFGSQVPGPKFFFVKLNVILGGSRTIRVPYMVGPAMYSCTPRRNSTFRDPEKTLF